MWAQVQGVTSSKTLSLEFLVLPDGSVSHASVRDRGLRSTSLDGCVGRAARSLQFEAFDGTKAVVVTHLFDSMK